MILDIITTLLGIGGKALEKKQQLKEIQIDAQAKIEIARAEAEVARLNKAQDAEITWDNEAAQQMEHSWKDEYLTLLLSMPMILAFCGSWGKEVVDGGFSAIASAPEWYKVSFLSAIAASFGIRTLVNKFGFGQK
jgi:hypothetical protein